MRTLLLFTALLFSAKAWCTITITGATGASALNLTGTPTIFGGLAGPACIASDGPGLCNNCVRARSGPCTNTAGQNQAPLCMCNTLRIQDSALLTITLNHTASTGGTTPPTPTGGNALATFSSVGGTTTGVVVQPQGMPNNGNSISYTWLQLCQQSATPASCEAQANATEINMTIFIDSNGNGIMDSGEDNVAVVLHIVNPILTTGVDDESVYGQANAEGIGGFRPYPGDEKVFIEGVNTPAGFPALTSYGLQANFARVYVSDSSLDNADASAPVPPTDLSIVDAGGNLQDNEVTSLNNGTRYFFRVAMVDQANNIVQFFPGNNPDPTCAAAAPDKSACPFSAVPDQVLGMLSKDVNCFIATAAYGSALEPKLDVFRAFRHRFLLPSAWGKAFVLKYYEYGPVAARYIADKPVVRAMARAGLWPVFAFSWLALRWGLTPALSLLILLLALTLAVPTLWVRSRRQRA